LADSLDGRWLEIAIGSQHVSDLHRLNDLAALR